MSDLDADLDTMDRDALLSAARAMRLAIRTHRDATGNKLCWHHPDLWDLLPDRAPLSQTVPEWPQFMRGCIRYRQSLDEQAPAAPRSDTPYRE